MTWHKVAEDRWRRGDWAEARKDGPRAFRWRAYLPDTTLLLGVAGWPRMFVSAEGAMATLDEACPEGPRSPVPALQQDVHDE